MSTITYAVWAFAAGALIPLMAILNAGLARATGGTIQATVLLFATGLTASLTEHHVYRAAFWCRQRDSVRRDGATTHIGVYRPLRIGGGRSATVDVDASGGTVYRGCRRSHHAGQ